MGTIETRALQNEVMGLCLGVACKLSFWRERLGELRAPSQAPKMALDLFVSVLRCSRLASLSTERHRVSFYLE